MSPSDYLGLHQRYARLLGDEPQTLSLSKEREEEIRKQLSELFDGMMHTLYSLEGSQFRIEVLAEPKIQKFINAHAGVLDSTFKKVEMSDAMRKRLQRSDYIFSGMKTFHELNEAFPSLLDSNGNRKTFEAFLNDVRKIDKTYNSNYLRAEYNFVQSSAEMAAKWERFSEDGDRYNLQYRTAGDGKVRPEHAALNGVTLPPSDAFWEEYYPPNGWNCRCTVVQVRKSKYPATPHDEAMALGEEALQRDTKGIFHFNSGKEDKTVPNYNPYTIRRCRDCDIAKGKIKLAKFIPENELCAACKCLRSCYETSQYTTDKTYGERLKISVQADQTEVKENTRAAHSLLSSFPEMNMQIRKHVYENGVKNPEYLINDNKADRKGIESPNGVASGFNKAIKQGCSVVVIDLDMHPNKFKYLPSIKLASAINNRHMDFENGTVSECYVIYNDKAVKITADFFSGDTKQTKERIREELEKIKGDRSHLL